MSLPTTHLQLLQGFVSHVGILEVDEGTETLMKNSDALYLTKPVTMRYYSSEGSGKVTILILFTQYRCNRAQIKSDGQHFDLIGDVQSQ